MNTQNRRRFPRIKFPHHLGVLHRGTYTVFAGDEIGEGGLSFYCCQDYFKIGDRLVLTIMTVGPMCVEAIVRNHRHSSDGTIFGVEFIDLNFDQARRLRFYVLQGQT